MALEAQLVAPSPRDPLLSKLDEPRVAEALYDLLDHADLLAILVLGLDGLVRRGDTISGSINKTVSDLRGATAGAADGLASLDLPKLVGSLRTLSGSLTDAAPGLDRLLRSELTDERAIDVVSLAARAMIKGAELAETDPVRVKGLLPLLRTLRDDDVARGLGYVIQIARALGRELGEDRPRGEV